MRNSDSILEAIKTIEEAQTKEKAISALKEALSVIGSEHILVTGIPMPQKKLNGLVILCEWPHVCTNKNYIADPSDLIIQKAIDWPAPFILREKFYHLSGLAAAVGLPRDNLEILIIPAITNFFYQGVIVTTFKRTPDFEGEKSEKSMSKFEQSALSCLTSAFFLKLNELQALDLKRDGELTKREQEVLSLSALGKTADEISDILKISNRTVVAHIQNASIKLNAANRTECVLQAIRYNQIGPGAGLGFYQLETEIYDT